MILKCIGGPKDGEYVDVGDMLFPLYKFAYAANISTELPWPPDALSLNTEEYTLERVTFSGNEKVYFLRLSKWTPIEAFNFLLRRHK